MECARKLLSEATETIRQVKTFDARRKTIIVKSCAPAPLWELLKKLGESCPEMTISSNICRNEEVLAAWEEDACDVAILPFPLETGKSRKFMEEHLFVCVPKDHKLAEYKELTFAEINGFNFLLRSELGFWDTLCRQKMPASKFLVQTEEFAFQELIQSSSLPCFNTDYGLLRLHTGYSDRVNIHLTDHEANVTFYIAVKKGCRVLQ